jgi:predicted kinase
MAAHFIAVVGPPCGGKSMLARRLAALLDAPHLEMDQFRSRLLVGSDQRVEHRDIAYRAMHFAAELLAPRCRTIVLDATYTAEVCRAELWGIAQRVSGLLSIVECRVSAAIAEQRFRERGTHPARDLTGQRVRALTMTYPYYERPEVIVAYAPDVAIARLVGEALDKRLNDSDGLAWCACGLPRESPMKATGDSDAEEQLARAGGSFPGRSIVEPRT